MSDEINYPTGFGLHDIVSWGNLGLICLDKSSNTVVKSPHDQENSDEIAIERSVYERFQEHGSNEGLLRYYGPYELGIRLEFACNGNLRRFLKTNAKDISVEQRLYWAAQIAKVLCFVHSANVIHGDLSCSNILLDGNLNAKLSDFGGSSLDGSPLLVAVAPSHRSPGSALSIQGDIFALGSTLYEIMTGDVPYRALSEEEIHARYAIKEFPETKFLGPMGDIIASCWHGRYNSFEAIIKDIRGIHAK
jgi:serine/threonine protein kinase